MRLFKQVNHLITERVGTKVKVKSFILNNKIIKKLIIEEMNISSLFSLKSVKVKKV